MDTLQIPTIHTHDRISLSFGKQAGVYNKYALVQRFAAKRLSEQLPEKNSSAYNIFEIGCGTGFVTELLAEKYPDYTIVTSDISSEMLQVCKENLTDAQIGMQNISFVPLNVEKDDIPGKYDLIVSGLTAQWFYNFEETVKKILAALKPNGQFILSFLTDDSFPEWKEICLNSKLLCTANTLPSKEISEQLAFASIVHYEPFSLELRFSKSIDFFRSLKSIGASTQKDSLGLNPADFRKLTRLWDKREKSSIAVTYKGLILTLQHA